MSVEVLWDYSYGTFESLSAPFMDASSACGIFDIILGLFIQTKAVVGKLVGKYFHASADTRFVTP